MIGPAPRSALFMPASNPRAMAKAQTLRCDAVILDLEDAVAPERKDEARDAAIEAAAAGFGERTVAIRVNARGTDWHAADVDAIRSARIDAIVLPKVEGADDLAAVRAAIGADGPPIWAMIENCAAILELADIALASAATRTTMLIAGTNDLAKDMRCRPDAARTPLVPALVSIVTAARAAGIGALDGVCNAIDDADRLAVECAQGAMLGFDGKTLIHPAQIDAANAAFLPTAEEIAWARAVTQAFAVPDTADKGAIRIEGAMVERLHLAEADRILALLR